MTDARERGGPSTVVVVGYSSLDSSTAIAEFRGVNATSILQRAIASPAPGAGGIAHITRAVAATGAPTEALSWIGADELGRRWTDAVSSDGSGTRAVATLGSRSPSATLIEIGTGGTICLFDPGDCHPVALTTEQSEVLAVSDWVVLTVAPRPIAVEVLEALSAGSKLVWAVKHDADAYSPELIRRILERADLVSFSEGERDYVAVDGIEPERRVRPGTLVVETRGADGVSWAFGSPNGATRAGSIDVERVPADDTTGAGDTFVGTLAGLLTKTTDPSELADAELSRVVASAASAAGDLLRRRATSGHVAGAPPKESL